MGRYTVPIKNAKFLSIVSFSAGYRGKHEDGEYAFWTAVLKKPSGRKKGVWGRARLIMPAGERFSRMAGKPAYKPFWVGLLDRGRNVAFVRPSTTREIAGWALSHRSDWKFVTRVSIKGHVYNRPADRRIKTMLAL